MADRLPKLTIENAKMIFMNFSGRVTQFNQSGERTFSVLLPEKQAETLAADGWNVKYLRPQDEDEEVGSAHLPVKVAFGSGRPPQIYVITSNNRTLLQEDSVFSVDGLEIASVDLSINPSQWTVNGKTGIKAYLSAAYITVVDDPLAAKHGI